MCAKKVRGRSKEKGKREGKEGEEGDTLLERRWMKGKKGRAKKRKDGYPERRIRS